MRRLVLLALLAVPGSLASQGAADEPGMYGYVLAPGGIPVSGGTAVSLSFGASASTSIDRVGRFRIPLDRAGVYRVVVNVPGFAPCQFRVTVPASRTLRLPVIHLEPATYFRVRFVSPTGEPITSPALRRRSVDGNGAPIPEAPDASSIELDGDGATRVGPLPHGITALALDTPLFAQTRVPNVSVTGADALLDGGTIAVQPGSTLHIDLLDASGMPVPDQIVVLEDVLPLSPLQFPFPVRTNAEGRVTFERLAAGRYRVRTVAVGRCVTQPLSLARTVIVPGTGTVTTRIVVAGKATFRISSAGAPRKGIAVSAGPDNPLPASPVPVMGRGAPSTIALSLTTTNCRGTTDADGRVTLTSFPPGASDIAVHFAYSLYVRRLDVPIGGGEIAVSVPDGFLRRRDVDDLADQVGVRAGEEVIEAHVDVLDARGQLGGEVIAQRFRRQQLEVAARGDERAARLRHLLAVDGDESVRVDPRRLAVARTLEHRRPEQCVEVDDVLADEVVDLGRRVGAPEVAEDHVVVGAAVVLEAGHVADRRVHPDIEVLIGRAGNQETEVWRIAADVPRLESRVEPLGELVGGLASTPAFDSGKDDQQRAEP
jgi:hypothetical protein